MFVTQLNSLWNKCWGDTQIISALACNFGYYWRYRQGKTYPDCLHRDTAAVPVQSCQRVACKKTGCKLLVWQHGWLPGHNFRLCRCASMCVNLPDIEGSANTTKSSKLWFTFKVVVLCFLVAVEMHRIFVKPRARKTRIWLKWIFIKRNNPVVQFFQIMPQTNSARVPFWNNPEQALVIHIPVWWQQ